MTLRRARTKPPLQVSVAVNWTRSMQRLIFCESRLFLPTPSPTYGPVNVTVDGRWRIIARNKLVRDDCRLWTNSYMTAFAGIGVIFLTSLWMNSQYASMSQCIIRSGSRLCTKYSSSFCGNKFRFVWRHTPQSTQTLIANNIYMCICMTWST